MKVFIIGGCHVDNYGLQPHLGFVQQWATHLKVNTQEAINITCLGTVKLHCISDILVQYQSELTQADLIVLQLGHYELSWRKRFSELFRQVAPGNLVPDTTQKKYQPKTLDSLISSFPLLRSSKPARFEQLKEIIKTTLLTLHGHIRGKLPVLKQVTHDITHVFRELTPYQEKIIVMTPFPTLNRVDQWLRQASYPIITKAAIQEGFTLLDTFSKVPRQKAYFLADGVHLNSLGHLIVALCLSEVLLPIKRFDNRTQAIPLV